MLSRLGLFCSSLTLEPILLLRGLAGSIISGSDLGVRLDHYKICTVEFNRPRNVCENLLAKENLDLLKQVQIIDAEWDSRMQVFTLLPIIFYAIFIGSIIDAVGVKKPLVFNMVGYTIDTYVDLFAVIFIDTLPMEIRYAQTFFSSFFGGGTAFSICTYNLCALITKNDERAMKLSLFEAASGVAVVIGTPASPYLYYWLGEVPLFATRALFYTLALIYIITRVKVPVVQKEPATTVPIETKQGNWLAKVKNFLMHCGVKQIDAIIKIVFRKRPNKLRTLILIQILISGYYFASNSVFTVASKYLLLRLPDFDERQSSYKNIGANCLEIFGLAVIFPLLCKKMKIHGTLLNVLACILNAMSKITFAFMTQYWQLYLGLSLGVLNDTVRSISIALITQMIHPSEFGRMTSGIAIFNAMISPPMTVIYLLLYKATLSSFPGTVFLLSAGIMATAAPLNFVIYLRRHQLPDEVKLSDLKSGKEENAGADYGIELERVEEAEKEEKEEANEAGGSESRKGDDEDQTKGVNKDRPEENGTDDNRCLSENLEEEEKLLSNSNRNNIVHHL